MVSKPLSGLFVSVLANGEPTHRQLIFNTLQITLIIISVQNAPNSRQTSLKSTHQTWRHTSMPSWCGMLRPLSLLALALSSCGISNTTGRSSAYQPAEGDILFQSLPNPTGMDLVDAIEGSTASPYSHCGMVFQEGGDWKVIEAIGPVKITPLKEYVSRGRGGKVWAYRLDESNRKHVPAALAAMRKDLGKPYDPRYRFDDEAIYCSELIWRGWKAATGKELGKTVTLGSLNWKPYQPVIEAIEGSGNLPLDRKMITPRDLAKAKELTLVFPE